MIGLQEAKKLIRNSAKAILINNSQLLTVKYRDEKGIFYALPGGGQEVGESLYENVQRECREEVGLDIQVGDLLFIREWISEEKNIHQVEFIFMCTAEAIESAIEGPNPDGGQLGIEWLPLKQLVDYRLYPLEIRSYLSEINKSDTKLPVYLGVSDE